jgi:hypothetical protein
MRSGTGKRSAIWLVERLMEALNTPEDRNEAAEAIRALVEKITLRPGPHRGEIDAPPYTANWARSSDGSKHKPLESLANAKLPQLSPREYRYLGCGDRI